MEKKGRERRKSRDVHGRSLSFLRSRKRKLCDRRWLGVKRFQQFR